MTSNRRVQKPSGSLLGATSAFPLVHSTQGTKVTLPLSRGNCLHGVWTEMSPKCKLQPLLLGYYEDIFVLYVADDSVPFFNFFLLVVSIIYDGDNKKRLLIGMP